MRAAVGSLLAELASDWRSDRIAAARTITRIFDGRNRADCELRGVKPEDLGWIIHRQAVLYAEEYGWGRRHPDEVLRSQNDPAK